MQYMEVEDLRRYPALDGGVPDGMSLRQWQMANGWRWECQNCDKPCYGSEPGEEGDGGAVVDDDEHVFCSAGCLERYTEKWALNRAINAAIREDFERANPGVEVYDVYHNEWYGYAVPKNKAMVTVWEFLGPHEDHFERRRILREMQEKA